MHMCPCAPLYDCRDALLGQRKLPGQRRIGHTHGRQATDLANDGLCRSRSRVAFTHQDGIDAATLGDLVSGVGLMCPEEQVRGVAARRIVAVMADQQTIGDRAIDECPSETVRELRPAIAFDAAVPGVVEDARPRPAITGAINLGPEALGRLCGGKGLKLSHRQSIDDACTRRGGTRSRSSQTASDGER